mmetsp:Transcript_33281/g.94687  ORF Transcript_33281/g.94687 Transcript_33281/m.94687 type:complete len:260 (+) Transcript_33281:849-1628(+)
MRPETLELGKLRVCAEGFIAMPRGHRACQWHLADALRSIIALQPALAVLRPSPRSATPLIAKGRTSLGFNDALNDGNVDAGLVLDALFGFVADRKIEAVVHLPALATEAVAARAALLEHFEFPPGLRPDGAAPRPTLAMLPGVAQPRPRLARAAKCGSRCGARNRRAVRVVTGGRRRIARRCRRGDGVANAPADRPVRQRGLLAWEAAEGVAYAGAGLHRPRLGAVAVLQGAVLSATTHRLQTPHGGLLADVGRPEVCH